MNEAILREGKNFAVKKKVSDCNRKRDDLNLGYTNNVVKQGQTTSIAYNSLSD